jgi:hypothetical protein
MNKLRVAGVTVIASLGVMLVGAGSASAQTTTPEAAPLTKTVALTGNKSFTGTYTINRFRSVGGQLVAVGTVKGTVRKAGKTRKVTKRNVKMPAALTGGGATAAQQPLPNLPNSCQVLNLTLGPINLNLLGLVVRTNQMQVRIDAQRGPGNLLGNLLCAITGILNPGGGLGQLTAPSTSWLPR